MGGRGRGRQGRQLRNGSRFTRRHGGGGASVDGGGTGLGGSAGAEGNAGAGVGGGPDAGGSGPGGAGGGTPAAAMGWSVRPVSSTCRRPQPKGLSTAGLEHSAVAGTTLCLCHRRTR